MRFLFLFLDLLLNRETKIFLGGIFVRVEYRKTQSLKRFWKLGCLSIKPTRS